MTDLVYDYITMGVDMMISAAVLAAVVILLRGSVALTQISAVQQENSARVNYYKEYNMYDNTDTLSSADAKSALLYYRYDLEVKIQLASNKIIINDPVTGKIKYTTNGTAWYELTDVTVLDNPYHTLYLNPSFKYRGSLFEDGSNTPSEYYNGGAITGLGFVRY